jgi:hypothetical protein
VVTQLTYFGITISSDSLKILMIAGCTSEARRSALFGKQKSHGSKSSNQACTYPNVKRNAKCTKGAQQSARGPFFFLK